MTKTKEWIYRYNQAHRFQTECSCFVCRAKTRLIDFASRIDDFYIWLRSKKWITVEYQGSDYSDFREYEVIGRKKVRIPDGKGFQWPTANYKYIRMVDLVFWPRPVR